MRLIQRTQSPSLTRFREGRTPFSLPSAGSFARTTRMEQYIMLANCALPLPEYLASHRHLYSELLRAVGTTRLGKALAPDEGPTEAALEYLQQPNGYPGLESVEGLGPGWSTGPPLPPDPGRGTRLSHFSPGIPGQPAHSPGSTSGLSARQRGRHHRTRPQAPRRICPGTLGWFKPAKFVITFGRTRRKFRFKSKMSPVKPEV